MINIDLHIHTIKTKYDNNDFKFSINKLKEYVDERKLDVIAITNHNVFDIDNYNGIVKHLDEVIVLPGIEVSFDTTHLLIISSYDDIAIFNECCKKVELIVEDVGALSLDDFNDIFASKNNFLYIPHYDKKPKINKNLIKKMRVEIYCGEESNPNQFIRMKKKYNGITPVVFSDYRPDENNNYVLGNTFIDVFDKSFIAIKEGLKDINKVFVSNNNSIDTFQILKDGTCASTGLNVIIGKRSSGKSYTINQIYNNFSNNNDAYPNVKYIKQFELVERDEEKSQLEFDNKIASRQAKFSDEYLENFKTIVDYVQNIDIETQNKVVDEYLTNLLEYANNLEKHDIFAKVPLFSCQGFSCETLDELKKLIDSTLNLLDTDNYKSIINKHITADLLIALFRELIEEYEKISYENKTKLLTNEIISLVKKDLSIESNQDAIPSFDIVDYSKNLIYLSNFIKLVKEIEKESVIKKEEVGKFTIEAKKFPITSAKVLQNIFKTKGATKSFYDLYNNPYDYLLSLLKAEYIPNDELYKAFVEIRYVILNENGLPVSGGQRTEFILEEKLKDAENYEMLLIDELESSFDNIFLKDNINLRIKQLSKNMPVFISTHNSTVGVSIKPDYLIYTESILNDNNEICFDVYSGSYTSRCLTTISDKTIPTYDAIINCLEGGEIIYNERNKSYETIKN